MTETVIQDPEHAMTDDSSMTTARSTVQVQAPRCVGLLLFALLLGANGL